MVKSIIRISLNSFVLFSSLTSLTLANDNEILEFTSSVGDPKTGKAIMKKIKKAHTKFFVRKVEEKMHSSRLAYTLTCVEKKPVSSKSLIVDFSNTYVDTWENSIETKVSFIGKEYKMSLELKMTGDCLTEKGKRYFESLARGQRGLIK